jgi:hypothetical protein
MYLSSCRCQWGAAPTPWDVRICWGEGANAIFFVPGPLVTKNDGVEVERGGGDYALIINISRFECTMSKYLAV